MTIKSIFEIDVQDDKFKEFNRLFDRYRENLSHLPGQWGIIAKGTGQAADAFDALAKKHAAAVVAGRIEEAAKRRAAELVKRMDRDALTGVQRIKLETQAWGTAVGKVAGQWKSVATYSAKTGTHIASATLSLLKWTSVLGGVSALIGAGGGLFGIDRLAASAAAGRRSSAGLGVRYGQQRAFSLDYGRFVDADGMLANVSSALSDKTSTGYRGLLGAGVSSKYADTHDAADVSVEVLKRLPEIFKGVQPGLIGPTAEARGLTDVLSVEDIKRYLAASPQERQQQEQAYRSDSRGLDIDPSVSRAWQDLTTQLGRAGSQIETTFIVGLKPLAKPIDDASSAFADLTAAFLKSDVVKTGIEGLASGMEEAAKYIGTPQFKDDVKGFVNDVGHMAKALADAYKWVMSWLPKTAEDKAKDAGLSSTDAGVFGNNQGVFGSAINRGRQGLDRIGHNAQSYQDRVTAKLQGFGGGRGQAGWWTPERQSHAVDVLMRDAGLTEEGAKALVSRWKNVESPGGPTSSNNIGGGHRGIGQWGPNRQAGMGQSFDEQLKHAADELNGPEARAKTILNTPMMGSVGASVFERGEGYDARTGRDNFTNKTDAGMAGVAHSPELSSKYSVNPAASTTAAVSSDSPEVAEARRYLAQTATGAAAQRPDSIVKLNPAFALAAAKAIKQARSEGIEAGIGSGYRSFGQTGSAYDAQGFSGHSYGIASDFSGIGAPGSATARRFDEISRGAGLGGYGADNPREWNHKELGDHLQRDPALLARMRGTLGPNGEMVDPQATWAASGYALPKGAGEQFPQVAKAAPTPLAGRTFGSYLAQSGGGAPQAPKGDADATVMSDGSVVLYRSRGLKFHRQIQALQSRLDRDVAHTATADAHQHTRNAIAVLKAHQHRLTPWREQSFAARVAAAKSAEGIRRAREEGSREAAFPQKDQPRRTSGLSDDRFQRKPMPHVLVQNNTGANVNVTAAMAGATVGYG